MSTTILDIKWSESDMGDEDKIVLTAVARLSDGKEIKVNSLSKHNALEKINLEFIKHVTGQFISFGQRQKTEHFSNLGNAFTGGTDSTDIISQERE